MLDVFLIHLHTLQLVLTSWELHSSFMLDVCSCMYSAHICILSSWCWLHGSYIHRSCLMSAAARILHTSAYSPAGADFMGVTFIVHVWCLQLHVFCTHLHTLQLVLTSWELHSSFMFDVCSCTYSAHICILSSWCWLHGSYIHRSCLMSAAALFCTHLHTLQLVLTSWELHSSFMFDVCSCMYSAHICILSSWCWLHGSCIWHNVWISSYPSCAFPLPELLQVFLQFLVEFSLPMLHLLLVYLAHRPAAACPLLLVCFYTVLIASTWLTTASRWLSYTFKESFPCLCFILQVMHTLLSSLTRTAHSLLTCTLFG